MLTVSCLTLHRLFFFLTSLLPTSLYVSPLFYLLLTSNFVSLPLHFCFPLLSQFHPSLSYSLSHSSRWILSTFFVFIASSLSISIPRLIVPPLYFPPLTLSPPLSLSPSPLFLSPSPLFPSPSHLSHIRPCGLSPFAWRWVADPSPRG